MSKPLYVPGDTCRSSGKHCYKSPQEAHWADQKIGKRRGTGRDNQAYQCDHCRLWHLCRAQRRGGK